MLTDNPLVAFVGTTDRARAKEFYGLILGLKLLREEPVALAYECNGTALRVVDVDKVGGAPYTVLGWSVKDAGKKVAELVERGVEIIQYDDLEQDCSGIWTS